jgi:predicted nucleotidyltransferase
MTLPVEYRHDIEKAIGILKSEGDVEIYLFGSLVAGNVHQRSDIDIAVRGLPPACCFEIFGRLPVPLDHPVDLVDLDPGSSFGPLKFIEMENTLSDALGGKVDLLMKDGLKPRISKRSLKEVVCL